MCQIVFPKVPKAVILKHHTIFFYFNYLVFLERATWHIWPPMWCFQGSVLQFSQCFVVQSCLVTTVTAVIIVTTVTTVTTDTTVTSVTTVTTVTTVNQCYVLRQRFAILAMFFDRLRGFIFWEVVWFCVLRGCVIFLTQYVCEEVAWFIVWRGCVIYCVKRLRDFLCQNVFLVKKKVFLWRKKKLWKKFFWSLLSLLSLLSLQ